MGEGVFGKRPFRLDNLLPRRRQRPKSVSVRVVGRKQCMFHHVDPKGVAICRQKKFERRKNGTA